MGMGWVHGGGMGPWGRSGGRSGVWVEVGVEVGLWVVSMGVELGLRGLSHPNFEYNLCICKQTVPLYFMYSDVLSSPPATYELLHCP